MAYVRNADLTIDHVRRLADRCGYTEVTAKMVVLHPEVAFAVEIPEEHTVTWTSLPEARRQLTRDLRVIQAASSSTVAESTSTSPMDVPIQPEPSTGEFVPHMMTNWNGKRFTPLTTFPESPIPDFPVTSSPVPAFVIHSSEFADGMQRGMESYRLHDVYADWTPKCTHLMEVAKTTILPFGAHVPPWSLGVLFGWLRAHYNIHQVRADFATSPLVFTSTDLEWGYQQGWKSFPSFVDLDSRFDLVSWLSGRFHFYGSNPDPDGHAFERVLGACCGVILALLQSINGQIVERIDFPLSPITETESTLVSPPSSQVSWILTGNSGTVEITESLEPYAQRFQAPSPHVSQVSSVPLDDGALPVSSEPAPAFVIRSSVFAKYMHHGINAYQAQAVLPPDTDLIAFVTDHLLPWNAGPLMRTGMLFGWLRAHCSLHCHIGNLPYFLSYPLVFASKTFEQGYQQGRDAYQSSRLMDMDCCMGLVGLLSDRFAHLEKGMDPFIENAAGYACGVILSLLVSRESSGGEIVECIASPLEAEARLAPLHNDRTGILHNTSALPDDYSRGYCDGSDLGFEDCIACHQPKTDDEVWHFLYEEISLKAVKRDRRFDLKYGTAPLPLAYRVGFIVGYLHSVFSPRSHSEVTP